MRLRLPSATAGSISTPRFRGPGGRVTASGRVSARVGGLRPQRRPRPPPAAQAFWFPGAGCPAGGRRGADHAPRAGGRAPGGAPPLFPRRAGPRRRMRSLMRINPDHHRRHEPAPLICHPEQVIPGAGISSSGSVRRSSHATAGSGKLAIRSQARPRTRGRRAEGSQPAGPLNVTGTTRSA